MQLYVLLEDGPVEVPKAKVGLWLTASGCKSTGKFYAVRILCCRMSKKQKHQVGDLTVIAPFNNMGTLKFKAQITIWFFSAVNQNYGEANEPCKTEANKMY